MPDPIATILLPPDPLQAGYVEALSERSHFHVETLGQDLAIVRPAEGAGQTFEYFRKTKLCDAQSDLGNPATWLPLRETPPRLRSDVDPTSYRDEMIRHADQIMERSSELHSHIAAFSLVAQGAVQADELESLLESSVGALFELFPEGELWYITTDDLLLARLMLAQNQLAFQLTPDIQVGPDTPRHDAFSDLTLTKGIDFSSIMQFPLLALSPSVLGFVTPLLPQMLVFTFGTDVELRQPIPFSLSSTFRPGVLGSPQGVDREEFLAGTQTVDGGEILDWWIGRANVIYSHLADPTRFTDEDGQFDAAAQTAWMVTIERLLADSISLLSEPQATDLDRIQMAFDLFDKSESLLGYGYGDSGAGFEALLRREQSVRRVRQCLAGLPPDLASRIGDEAENLFENVYSSVLDKTATSRFTPSQRGVKIVKGPPENTTVSMDLETFVVKFLRAVRNSSHGLIGTLAGGEERYLLAINSGGVPASFPSLAPLIALCLLADAESLIDKSWKGRLLGTHVEGGVN